MFRDGLETLPVAEGAENEAKLHESYQALYRDMVDKFTKFGLQEYHAVSTPVRFARLTRSFFHNNGPSLIRSFSFALSFFLSPPSFAVQVVGEKYDAAVHEKAGELQLELPGSADDPAPNTVTEEVASGLKMKVGVVRRAKVVVAMAAPEPEKEEEPEEEVAEEATAATEEEEAAGEADGEASEEAQEEEEGGAPPPPKEEMPY